MKRSIYAFIVLSLIGAVLSLLLLYQHHFPDASLGVFSCGRGAVNPCLAIARSGFGEVFGFPLAGLGAMAYFFILGAALVALAAGEERYPLLFAALLPLAAVMIAAVIPLVAIMIWLGVVCRLCAATYAVNILIGAALALSYADLKRKGVNLRLLYRELFSSLRKRENIPMAVCGGAAVIFGLLFMASFSAYLKVRGEAATRIDPRAERFREYYHSLAQEELSLPPSALSQGNPNAEIRIAVFTDFLCTACHRFHVVKKALMARFPGRIRIEYYNFPLDTACNRHSQRTVYPNSCVTSQAFLAAAARGDFEGLLESHFSRYPENKSRLHKGDSLLSVNEYFRERMSEEERARFLREALSERLKLALHEEVELGGSLNIGSVPTLFINGKRIVGVPDAALLESVIADELR